MRKSGYVVSLTVIRDLGEKIVNHPTGSQEFHKNVRNPPRSHACKSGDIQIKGKESKLGADVHQSITLI